MNFLKDNWIYLMVPVFLIVNMLINSVNSAVAVAVICTMALIKGWADVC